MPHEKATWRGSNPHSPTVDVCRHMVDKLDAWADAVGNDILLKALPGCGSYQTTTKASADTHRLGGAIDINTIVLSPEQRVRVETEGRRVGLLVWRRRRIPDLWTWHAHALDPACSRLSSQAKAQFEKFRKGRNGLDNDGDDQGDRAFADDILAVFDRVQAGFGPHPDFDFPYGPGFPVPGEPGSMYGRANAGEHLYSGTVNLDPQRFKNTGTRASGFLTLVWIRGHIKRIQRLVGVEPNGLYQGVTEAAVTDFQRAQHLVVDGKVGPQTWRAMAATKLQ